MMGYNRASQLTQKVMDSDIQYLDYQMDEYMESAVRFYDCYIQNVRYVYPDSVCEYLEPKPWWRIW